MARCLPEDGVIGFGNVFLLQRRGFRIANGDLRELGSFIRMVILRRDGS